MKLLLSLCLLLLLIGCATAPKPAPAPNLHHFDYIAGHTNWIPSGLWTDTDGKMYFLERCQHTLGEGTCQGEWVLVKPAVPSGTFTNGIPTNSIRQFYPPIPRPTRPKIVRDPLNHP